MFKISSKLEKHQHEYKSKTPTVKATLWSNKNLKTKFRAGMKFYIIYVKNLDEKVIAFEDKEQLIELNELHKRYDSIIAVL